MPVSLSPGLSPNTIRLTDNNELRMSLGPGGSLGAFGELPVVRLVPHAGWTFAYTLLNHFILTAKTGSGAEPVQDNGHGKVSTTAATSSSSEFYTKRKLRYEPGFGGLARFTALFTTGVAGSQQFAGVGRATEDGYFFGFNGADFGVCRVRGGVEDWTPQTSWNVDRMDGSGDTSNPSGVTSDFTKGNVYAIRYQWLGYGAIQFYMECAVLGTFQLVHVIHYTNRNTETSIVNPILPASVYAVNTTNNTDIVVKSPSMMLFSEGGKFNGNPLGQIHGESGTSTVTTEAPVFAVRGLPGNFIGVANRVTFFLKRISLSTDGTKNFTFRLYRGPATLTGGTGGTDTDGWIDIEAGQSTVQYNNTATAFTGGDKVDTFNLQKVGSLRDALSDLNLQGDSVTSWLITAASSSSGDASAALTFEELF